MKKNDSLFVGALLFSTGWFFDTYASDWLAPLGLIIYPLMVIGILMIIDGAIKAFTLSE